jgi:hypothetical protein
MINSLTFALQRDYAFHAPQKQGSRLASRKIGGQPPLSGFFTSVIHSSPFMGGSCGREKSLPVLSRYANLHESAHPIGVGRAENINRLDRSLT